MSTIVIIPCYNEAERLNSANFLQFARQQSNVQLLLVNDGSRDRTAERLEELAAASAGRIAALQLTPNRGKAEAVRQGILHALERDADYVGYWDADLATPLEDIPAFVSVLNRRPEIDIVVGSRLPLLGHAIARHPLRKLLGRLFATVASRALGISLYDTQCGAKLFRVTEETHQLFAEPFATRWIFDVELIARLINLRQSRSAAAAAIYEFPLDRWEDVPGSKLRPRHFVQAFGELVQIYSRYVGPFSRRYVPVVRKPAPTQLGGRRAA